MISCPQFGAMPSNSEIRITLTSCKKAKRFLDLEHSKTLASQSDFGRNRITTVRKLRAQIHLKIRHRSEMCQYSDKMWRPAIIPPAINPPAIIPPVRLRFYTHLSCCSTQTMSPPQSLGSQFLPRVSMLSAPNTRSQSRWISDSTQPST